MGFVGFVAWQVGSGEQGAGEGARACCRAVGAVRHTWDTSCRDTSCRGAALGQRDGPTLYHSNPQTSTPLTNTFHDPSPTHYSQDPAAGGQHAAAAAAPWTPAVAAALEQAAQQLFGLLGGDATAYSACVALHWAGAAESLATAAAAATAGTATAGAAATADASATASGFRLGNRAAAGQQRGRAAGAAAAVAAVAGEWAGEPGVSRALDVLLSYGGLPLLVRAELARAGDDRKRGERVRVCACACVYTLYFSCVCMCGIRAHEDAFFNVF